VDAPTWNLVSYTKLPTNRIRSYSNESTEVESEHSVESEDSREESQAENQMRNDVEDPRIISEDNKSTVNDLSVYSDLPLHEKLQYTKSTKFSAFGNTIIRASYTAGMF
jgi:hypothetical protein